jgi:hypothetical protein
MVSLPEPAIGQLDALFIRAALYMSNWANQLSAEQKHQKPPSNPIWTGLLAISRR